MKPSAAAQASDIGKAVAVALLLGVGKAWAHGERPAGNPWVEGAKAVFAEPASLMVVLALAALMAQPGQQPGQPSTTLAWWGAAAGLLAGMLVAAAGLVLDLTLPLLALCFGIGVLVAWERPLPAVLHAVLTAAVAAGVVLMTAPAVAAGLGFRWSWLAASAAATGLLFANTVALLRALLGRRPGPIRRMLLRVVGSWFAAAAMLVLVLQSRV